MIINFPADRARISTKLSKSLNIQSQYAINFQNILQFSNIAQGIAVDMSCKNISTIFQYTNQSFIFKNNYFWLFFDESYMNIGEISVR